MTLADLLISLGNQTEAAQKVGVSQRTISGWMRSENLPRGLAVRALAQATGLPMTAIESAIAEARSARLVAPSALDASMGQVPCPEATGAPVGVAQ